MIYTEALKTALLEALTDEADYSGWDDDYVARNRASYETVTLGTELVSDRDFEAMIADDQLTEADLTPIENVILSSDYFGLNHLAV